MGAICKTIPIHSENLQHLLDYGADKEKTSLDASDLQNLLTYASNEEKTSIIIPENGEQSVLVSGVLCTPETAKAEFEQVKNKYRESNPEYLPSFDYLDKRSNSTNSVQKKPITAIHLIQSFEETDIDPRLAHQIGLELCERLGVQAVVDTHVNKEHVHNHIIINAYMPDALSKFSMNNEKRIEVRRLSDQIQREYGLEINFLDPAVQQKIASHSLNYKEWQAQRDGLSWKDQMREDMAIIRENVSDKDEFIEMMQDYGYVLENQKGTESIMWRNPSSGRTVWDSTLGEDYMLKNLFPDEVAQHEIEVETDKSQKTHHQRIPIISVAKCDYSGRKRTELELIIRRAIAIIQKVANLINSRLNSNKTKYNVKAKLNLMQEALITLNEFGIKDTDSLNKALDLAGKNLSIAKSAVGRINGEMQYYSTVERVIAEYQDALQLYNSVHYWQKPHDLYINQFSQRDIALSAAKIAPMSDQQKTELYQLMSKRPNLRLVDAGKGYSNISAIQFRQIKDYFKGVGERPDCLVEASDTTVSFAYERQYQFLSEKILYEPSKAQRSKAKQLLVEHGFDFVDESKLTMADIINIDNCYGQCPLENPLITIDKQQYLQLRLDQAGKSTYRGIDQIMEKEYDQILAFLDGKVKKTPNIMKSYVPASETDIKKTRKLAAELGIHPSVDINAMSNDDVKNLYNWMVSQGKDPMCTNQANAATWGKNKDLFHSDIAAETPRKQEVLIGLRNASNALAQLGIQPEDIPQILTRIEELKLEQRELKDTQADFADQYKQLLHLRQQVSHANDKHFLFGTLFDESEIKTIEEELKEQEKAQEQDTEPEKTDQKEPSDKVLQAIERATRKHHILDKDLDL
mgnify:CR=1 FL=1